MDTVIHLPIHPFLSRLQFRPHFFAAILTAPRKYTFSISLMHFTLFSLFLFYLLAGGAFDITDINLLEALDLRSNNSPYPGVTVIKGHHKEFAYRLSGKCLQSADLGN